MNEITLKYLLSISVLAFFTWELANCNILRLPCKKYGLFNNTVQNFVFNGSVIANFVGITSDGCEQKCRLNNRCKSINVKEGEKCELISKTAFDVLGSRSALVGKSDWTYKAIDYNVTMIGENCQILSPCEVPEVCRDTCDCAGFKCSKVFKDCKAVYDAGFHRSNVYDIAANGFPLSGLPIFCDMETKHGPWMVFQRRVDNTVDFYRNWSEYKHGFGEPDGNFWLGLDKLHLLAAPGRNAILRVDIRHRSDVNKKHAIYTTFEIGNEADAYRLNVGGYLGNAGDSMANHNGMVFTTYDLPGGGCARRHMGGWWYKLCHTSNLNGLYPTQHGSTDPKYISWWRLKHKYGNIIFSEMKLRHPVAP